MKMLDPTGSTSSHRTHRLQRLVAVLSASLLMLVVSAVPASGSTDETSLWEISATIGAHDLHAAGLTGSGIDVAVIDTGVNPVHGLNGDDKLIIGPDLSFEAGVEDLYGQDTYGHGTVMASIIAGEDGPGGFQGIAPGARILSVKVADNTGAVDVSQVIAALDWITANGQSNGLNVRVINLSYVTDSEQPYEIDPLAAAVERAWDAGYVVVVSAGNRGGKTEALGNPAADPFVIAVAAADDDGEAEYSNRGSDTRRPDILAPGDRVLGLVAPDSRLAQENPQAVIDGHYLRGSGTSQATAVVSGAAALLLEQRPELTPDQIKALLIMGAVDEKGESVVSDLKPFEDTGELLDEIDKEAAFRAEARALRAEAIILRSEGNEKAAEDAEDDAEKADEKADDCVEKIQELAVSDEARHLADAEAFRTRAAELRSEAIDHRAAADLLRLEASLLAEGDAKHLIDAAKDAEKAAEKADKKAGEADEDAIESDRKADKEAAKFQEEVDEIFESWSGRALGKIKFDDRTGAGFLDVSRAATLPVFDVHQAHPRSDSSGTLEASRGTDHVVLPNGATLFGETTFTGSSWSGSSWSGSSWSGSSWSGSSWSGSSWSGSSWSGSSWSGSSWSGSSWSGSSWSGSSWSGSSWSGSSWSGSSWSGSSWG